MKKNQNLADEIVRFFKAFRISIPISLILFMVLYFGIFQVQKTFNPDLSGVVRGEDMVFYGNDFNRKAMYNYSMHFGTSYDGTEEGWKGKVMDAIDYYKSSKTMTSIIISLTIFFGLPILIILIRLLNLGFSASKEWVDDNRTI
jgi:hypothetical protein